MLANYHIHTFRCHHATGLDEEYITKAIAEGLKILGFSDHAPYLYPGGYVSYYKMLPEEIGEYFSSLRALREKYRDEIEIHIGYEAEYYPALWDETYEFWKSKNPPEYLILGQHYINDAYERLGSGIGRVVHPTDKKKDLQEYVDTVISGMKTGAFTYVAHPDILNFVGDEQTYREEMARLIIASCETDTPLEINMLGLMQRRNYPRELFWQIASEYSPKVVLGCDAHNPERVADKDEILEAMRYADRFKLNITDTLKLRNPFKSLL